MHNLSGFEGKDAFRVLPFGSGHIRTPPDYYHLLSGQCIATPKNKGNFDENLKNKSIFRGRNTPT